MPRGRPKKQVAETKKLLETLTLQQIESIKDTDRLLLSLSLTFKDCEDIAYSQIRAIDNERANLNYLFKEVIHNN